ncbi:hypothetical protein GGGNBK_06110 [Sporosarcina sp. ANT_H38]
MDGVYDWLPTIFDPSNREYDWVPTIYDRSNGEYDWYPRFMISQLCRPFEWSIVISRVHG